MIADVSLDWPVRVEDRDLLYVDGVVKAPFLAINKVVINGDVKTEYVQERPTVWRGSLETDLVVLKGLWRVKVVKTRFPKAPTRHVGEEVGR